MQLWPPFVLLLRNHHPIFHLVSFDLSSQFIPILFYCPLNVTLLILSLFLQLLSSVVIDMSLGREGLLTI